MSINTAQAAFQEGLGRVGQVLSGSMRYDGSELVFRFRFNVRIPGETEPREYQVNVGRDQNQDETLKGWGRKAAAKLLSEKGEAA